MQDHKMSESYKKLERKLMYRLSRFFISGLIVFSISQNAFSATSCFTQVQKQWTLYKEELQKLNYKEEDFKKGFCASGDESKKYKEAIKTIRKTQINSQQAEPSRTSEERKKTNLQNPPYVTPEISDETADQVAAELELDIPQQNSNSVAQRAAAGHTDNDASREQCKKYCGDGNCGIKNEIILCQSGDKFNLKTGAKIEDNPKPAEPAETQPQSISETDVASAPDEHKHKKKIGKNIDHEIEINEKVSRATGLEKARQQALISDTNQYDYDEESETNYDCIDISMGDKPTYLCEGKTNKRLTKVVYSGWADDETSDATNAEPRPPAEGATITAKDFDANTPSGIQEKPEVDENSDSGDSAPNETQAQEKSAEETSATKTTPTEEQPAENWDELLKKDAQKIVDAYTKTRKNIEDQLNASNK